MSRTCDLKDNLPQPAFSIAESPDHKFQLLYVKLYFLSPHH